MNHAAKAALAVDDVVVATHEGLKRMFGLHLVRTGAVEREWAGHLHAALDQRVGADYDVSAKFTPDHAAVECDRAGRFIERMRVYLLSRGLPEPELVEVERIALNQAVDRVGHLPEDRTHLPGLAPQASELPASQQSQDAKPSWKDTVKKQFGIESDTAEIPPKAPAPPDAAAAAAQKRGPQHDRGPSK